MVTSKQLILKNALLLEINKFYESINTEDINHKISVKRLCSDLVFEKVLNIEEGFKLEVHLFGLLNLINNIKQMNKTWRGYFSPNVATNKEIYESFGELLKSSHIFNYKMDTSPKSPNYTIKENYTYSRNFSRKKIFLIRNVIYKSSVYWTIDGQYWAKTQQEIDLFNKYEKIYIIGYIPGVISPFIDNNHTVCSCVDGYEMIINGKLKFKYYWLDIKRQFIDWLKNIWKKK